jgi:small basic protein (TIGR04137 family)
VAANLLVCLLLLLSDATIAPGLPLTLLVWSLSSRADLQGTTMGLHSSLKSKGLGAQKRSVLKRQERINKLKLERRWKTGDNVTGLPKTRVPK